MNAHELRLYLDDVGGYTTDTERELHVSVSYANYGKLTTAILEWNGSPPKTRTILYFYGGDQQVIRISEFIPRSLSKKKKLGKIVYDFLVDNNHVKTSETIF